MMNFADENNPELIEDILVEAELLLNEFPNTDMVAQTYIRILHALNKNFYNIRVKKSQVEKAFAYVQRYPESESIREAFFDMLNDSDEKNIQCYKTKPIVNESINHILKNPRSLIQDPRLRLGEMNHVPVEVVRNIRSVVYVEKYRKQS